MFENARIIVMQENCVLHKSTTNGSRDLCCPLQQFINTPGHLPIYSQTNNKKKWFVRMLESKVEREVG